MVHASEGQAAALPGTGNITAKRHFHNYHVSSLPHSGALDLAINHRPPGDTFISAVSFLKVSCILLLLFSPFSWTISSPQAPNNTFFPDDSRRTGTAAYTHRYTVT